MSHEPEPEPVMAPFVMEAVEALFRAHAKAIAAYARALPPSPIDPDDLVQEAFIAAATRWESFSRVEPGKRLGWLKRVVRNKSIDAYRRTQHELPTPEHTLDDAEPSFEFFDQAVSAITVSKCWTAVQQMPPVRQRVAYLKWWEQWTSGEIAAHLGITQDTVRGHIKIARDEIISQVGSDAAAVNDTDADDAQRRSAPQPEDPMPLGASADPRDRSAGQHDANAEGRRTDGI